MRMISLLSDKQLRLLHAMPYNKLTKRQSLQLGLHDADRRYEIGVSKMSEITKRVQELEVERNQALRRNLIISEFSPYLNDCRSFAMLIAGPSI